MGTTFKLLGHSTLPAAAGDETVYTVPAATKAQISLIVMTAVTTSGGNGALSVHHIPNGGSEDVHQTLIYRQGLGVSATYVDEFGRGLIMEAGDAIQVHGDYSSSILDAGAIFVYGVEIT